MGWNSWYVWKRDVSDKIMRDAADAMVSTGLINHGYQYICIDDCWAMSQKSNDTALHGAPRDADGKINSNPRFPDMKALTDYIHAKGLKAGIYTSPGPLTCAGYTGSYGHEGADAERFAEWGFDLLKYDMCSYKPADPSKQADLKKPYQLMGELLRAQNRDIVMNLCQYGRGKVWEWGKQVGGQSWRTAGDLGGKFESISTALFRDGFDVYTRDELHKYGGPGGWNDPDYLLLGYLSAPKGKAAPTPLTPNEQYTHVSLWCLVAAPLFLSGDITRLDEFTLSLLTNDEMIDVDQDPLGKPGKRAAQDGKCEVWVRELADGSKAIGLFNRGDAEAKVTARWPDLGLDGKQIVRDLWRQQDLGTYQDEFQSPVPPHGVVMVRMRQP
jgi:alpha-galactosidase